jgi:hypothetical protein
MYALMRFRQMFRNAVATVFGSRGSNIVIFANQRDALLRTSEIMALPEQLIAPMYVTDTSSDDFGKTFFIAGYHAVGDADHPIGG